ncbi:hypothetical protein pEaSNUABM28_00240 [Erwinia phage pEa_SNUABM_28]|uniref:Uncharacterized protein n=1 Tax=Erwinia phage pEa_SNUABM_16 TaxID=2869544 RepID=A0AAE8XR30_9CAUD|nr:hypothetical protein MPK64_gp238 [Erwinia phage pEa_SNUABM_16]QZE58797.1 hypothetical protein pEaSNUABM28_00240 [Erwinia phage pEa_SNUABM_28]QZE59141.1 hypothetical protein pEaSNUABM18_00238 [Erwinia phage pEa_SNUABM_18]UAW96382.1 hypothetical protein pEaSNUABM16_00238 [Erwinia phage pEa_SNUABM_16]
MFFNNPAPGVIPNYPIVHSINEMHRRVAELNGELIAAGCTVVESCGEMLIEVPKGASAKVDDIIQRHQDMFKGPVLSRPGRLQIGGEDAEAEV